MNSNRLRWTIASLMAGLLAVVSTAQADDEVGVARISDSAPVVRGQSPDIVPVAATGVCLDGNCVDGTCPDGSCNNGVRYFGTTGPVTFPDSLCPDGICNDGMTEVDCPHCSHAGSSCPYCGGRGSLFTHLHDHSPGHGGHDGEGVLNWLRCKFGYFIPTGDNGQGAPPIGHYKIVYPLDPYAFDNRDGQLYAAPGVGGPVTVPIAPIVNHTYNYGWGIPSSRLTPISHPNHQFGIVQPARHRLIP